MKTIPRLRLRALCTAALVASWVPQARADEVRRGVVVRIEANQVYFDVAQKDGSKAGRQVRFKRPIKLNHPISRKVVTDELPMGELVIGAAGNVLSMAPASARMASLLRPGDIAEVRIPTEKPKAPVVDDTTPKTNPGVSEEAAAVLTTFRRSSGQRISERIAAWETFLQDRPASPFAQSIREDIKELRDLRKQLLQDESRGPVSAPKIDALAHEEPTRAMHGREFDLAFLAERPQDIVAAWLHFRHNGDPTYRRAALLRDGTGYLRATLSEAVMQAPGVDYFVEVAMQNGDVGSAIGSPQDPVAVAIDEPPGSDVFAEKKNRSRITINSSYLDYATFDKRPEQIDRFLQFEIDFLYRLRTVLYGVRVGFGSYNGTVDDSLREKETVGFNFGYTEFEFRTSETVAIAARLLAGHAKSGLGYGIEGKLRLGAEDKTNLLFEIAGVSEIGFLSGIRMELRATDALFVGFGIAVTDQPNQGALAVRLSTDVGLKVASWFQPVLRVSMQGRSVEHSGMGVGLGANFDW